MNSDIILKAENLYFSYDDEQSHSLNGLSLDIRRGQKVAFMGANGSGKSVSYTHLPLLLFLELLKFPVLLLESFLLAQSIWKSYFPIPTFSILLLPELERCTLHCPVLTV